MNPLRRQVQLLTGLTVLVAVLFLGGLWSLYSRSQQVLESELGARLRTVAAAAAMVVPADSLASWSRRSEESDVTRSLRNTMRSLLRENELSRIVVFDEVQTVVFDSAELLGPGSTFLFLREEEPAVQAAIAGKARAAPLRREGEIWLKAAYAPVYFGSTDFLATLENLQNKGELDDVGRRDFVAGFVGVFAHPSFFAELQTLRRSLVVVGGAVLALLLALATATHVTARRLERARQALLRAETLSSMGRMAAGIAHEIRNPLGIIKNSAQLLTEEMRDAGLDTEVVQYIPAEIDRLNETLTGYLEFAREAPLRREEVEVQPLLLRTVRMLGPELDRAGVRVEPSFESGLRVWADRRRLQQVILNLLLNALQAMPEGGALRVVARSGDGECHIDVSDQGTGIAADALGQIFEPFHTTREKGSGLGLFMVRRIVEEHGGKVTVKSEVGAGTTFTLSLPQADGSPTGRGDRDVSSQGEDDGPDPGSR